jgi:hypothetical protein
MGVKSQYGATAIYIENFTGLFLKDPKTGKRVLFSVRSGDDPILEITGPERLQRQDGTITLDTSRPRQLMEEGHASIPAETWWGNNGRGYGIDGQDWEWTLQSSGFPLRDKGALIGDVRLRRDAGSLYVLANIQGEAFHPVDGTASDLNSVWGVATGIELELAPEQSVQGDAVRIFLSADGKGGLALLRQSGENTWSRYAKAKVEIRPRWNGQGWRLEAELPLAALPKALRMPVDQTFRRPVEGKSELETKHAVLDDLVGPIRFNAAAHRMVGGSLQRVAWVADGALLKSPEAFAPNTWGTVSAYQKP